MKGAMDIYFLTYIFLKKKENTRFLENRLSLNKQNFYFIVFYFN